MTNEEILTALKQEGNNANNVLEYLPKWNKSEYEFPIIDAIQYIRMHEWKYTDFSFDMELVLMDVLPGFMHDVFFDIKEFRSNNRNELTSTCEIYGKLKGWPLKTQDEKAKCQYLYSFAKYYDNSMLHKNEGE